LYLKEYINNARPHERQTASLPTALQHYINNFGVQCRNKSGQQSYNTTKYLIR